MFTFKHEDPEFSGELFGVRFANGVAVSANANLVAYFRRRAPRGFQILDLDASTPTLDGEAPSRADLIDAALALDVPVGSHDTKSAIADAITDATS